MDKKNNFLSGMKQKLNLGGKEKWDTEANPFEGQEMDEDMAVLSLDSTPSAGRTDDSADSYKPQEKPELTLEPKLPEPDQPLGDWKPELKLDDTLSPDEKPEETPEPIIKPELTLEPDLPAEEDDFEDVGAPESAGKADEEEPETDDQDRWDMPDEPPKKDRWSWFRQKKDPGKEWEERISETEEEMAEAFSQEPPVEETAPVPVSEEAFRRPYDDSEEDEELEPDMDRNGNTGAIIRESAGRMASGVGAGLLSVLQFLWGFISEAFMTFAALSWEHLRNEVQPRNWKHLFSRYLLTLIIIYYELVLKFSTAKEPRGFAILYIILFSFCWGLLGYLLTTFLKPKTNRNARKILILVFAVPFIVSYFRYQRLGKFYGLSDTVPVTSNISAMFKIIFSASGLLHLLLFLLPAILYALVLYHLDAARRIRMKRRVRTVLTILGIWFITWLLVLANGNYRWAYSKEYTYQSAVCDFGLLSAMRLDVRAKIIGDGNKTSRTPESVKPAAEETAVEAETLPPESEAPAEETVPETTAPGEEEGPQTAALP